MTTRPKIFPWVECNSQDEELVARIVEGIRIWRRVTDTVIVTTTPGNFGLYRTIKRQFLTLPALHDMRIIPGLKTVSLLGDEFDNMGAWERVAAEAWWMLLVLGATDFVFEHETAVDDVDSLKDVVDLEAAITAAALPCPCQYWWYPSVRVRSEAEQALAARICYKAHKVISTPTRPLIFIDNATLAGPARTTGAHPDPRAIRAGERIRRIGPAVPLLYCYGPGSPWWQDVHLKRVIDVYVQESRCILYPGQERWVEAAESITKLLGDK